MAVMTKPEITKNTSTPTKPPGTGSLAWKATTRSTATARSPWMSARRVEGRATVSGARGARRSTLIFDAPR
jgi:hypothetical protein